MGNLLMFLPLIVLGALFYGIYRFLKARNPDNALFRLAVVVSLITAFLLFWVNGAVGTIGSSNNDANMLYLLIFLIGFAGGLVAKFRAAGLVRVLLLAALVQVLVQVEMVPAPRFELGTY